ncbi:GNAT family N-acetyltransferase [Pseudomonas asuensis]|uniref:N-acetyltransferase n=1 Tax=Pseudomonas asuensis TaxID=1825787 RepID=A0ABQ2GL82_9PSED|nr:GNAT family N-acetyltransferase [Pseudomonas asuensis]GGM01443.1 N-acetyltransferase [Pseudomonas asuensis]
MTQPTLVSDRLVLSPLLPADAPRIQLLANSPLIADVTAHIPHPYPDGLAESWIASHSSRWQAGELAAFGIRLKDYGQLIGVISLNHIRNRRAMVAYWIGIEYWNQGYGSEACKTITTFGFQGMDLIEIRGNHLARNPASGRVLVKSGFEYLFSKPTALGLKTEEMMMFYRLTHSS